jgi:ribosomal protein S18 acetylase RimI-like enzyme
MAEIRRARVSDAEAIGRQRVRMFVDAGIAVESEMGTMVANFVPWVRARLGDGSYAGWLVEGRGGPVAGAGLWVMEWPPHFLDAAPRRGYLVNFYVAPELRRQGLARKLLDMALGEAKARRLKVVTLHASKFGKLLYEQSGFVMSNEMRLQLED